MARPRKNEEKNRNVLVAYRVTEPIDQEIRRQAAERGVSMGDIANEALAVGLRQLGRKAGTEKKGGKS